MERVAATLGIFLALAILFYLDVYCTYHHPSALGQLICPDTYWVDLEVLHTLRRYQARFAAYP